MTTPPTDPPAEAPSGGDATIRAALDRLHEDVRRRRSDWLEAVRREVLAPLHETFAAAAEAHGALLRASGLDVDAPGERPAGDAGAPQAPLRSYRRRSCEEVIQPLRDRLECLDLTAALSARRAALDEELSGLADAMPTVVPRPEPEALYAPAPGEPAARRLRKARVRLTRRRRAATRGAADALRRLVRKAPRPLPPPVQRVPLHALADYHVRVRLPRTGAPLDEALRQLTARPVAALERALTTWLHALLAADPDVGLAGDDLPPGAERAAGEEAAEPDGAHQRRIAGAAQALQRVLERGLDDAAVEALAAELDERLADAERRLETDVDRSDSFLLPTRTLPADAGTEPRSDRDDAWATWHRRAAARVDLVLHLLRFRGACEELGEEEIREMTERAAAPLMERFDASAARLEALARETGALCDTARAATDGSTEGLVVLREQLAALLDRATEELRRELLEPLQEARRMRHAQAAADAGADRLIEALQALPERLDLHVLPRQEQETVLPAAERREVRLRDWAEQSLDALIVERLRAAALPFEEAVARAEADGREIPTILDFNLRAAQEELAKASASDADADAAIDSAQELAQGGLTRSAGALLAARDTLEEAPPAAARTVRDAYTRGWARLQERIRPEGRVQEQWMDLRTRIRTDARAWMQKGALHARRGSAVARHLFRRSRRRAERLVRLGQSAVGAQLADERSLHRTFAALSDLDALVERFPLVYRRLFSFDPVTDPSMLDGRTRDLEAVARHRERWTHGLGGALLLTGFYGNGLTSFVNVLERDLLADLHPCRLDLDERIEDETELAGRLADVLDVPAEADARGGWTLDRLADALLRQERTPHGVCLIEHLEHLLLRTVGGTRLVERLLAFMSRTDRRILWIGTVSEQAWQFLSSAGVVAASLVSVRVLTPVDRTLLETFILNRHRRSGLTLVFDEPADLNPLLRRRLKRAKTEEERQRLLQTEHFDRLFRASGQNLKLAFFYWLHSAQLDPESRTLRITPVEPFAFSFLNAFPLSHAFTLKALLQHGTLTAGEHGRIFQLPEEESLRIFEALNNHLLIEPSPPAAHSSPLPPGVIAPDLRYRIRPLVIHPVTRYLESLNVLY